MKVTKSQKVCLGLLCAGLCALAVDRATSGTSEPGEDSAVSLAESSFSMATGTVSPEMNNKAAPTTSAEASLATRLDRLRSRGDVRIKARDAFAPGTSWTAVQATPAVTPAVDRAVRFREAHTLKAVVAAGRRGQALVDNSLVSVGQSLDGLVLESVSQFRAVFCGGDVRVELALPGAVADVREIAHP